MDSGKKTLAQHGLLASRHYLAGFTCHLDDHTITVRFKGHIWQRYGVNTPMAIIFHDVDQVIEMSKAVSTEMT